MAGTILLWVLSRRKVGPAHVLAVLSTATLIALAATVVLPQLSVDYGLLRLFQQSLVVLAPAVLLALTGVARVLGSRASAAASAVAVTGCLLSTCGLAPQIIGSYAPQLNLNNAGGYHRAYYTAADDLATAAWVRENLAPGTLLAADSADYRTLRSMTGLYPLEGVAPGIVPDDAYLQVNRVGPDQVESVAIERDRILDLPVPGRLCRRRPAPVVRHRVHRIYGPVSVSAGVIGSRVRAFRQDALVRNSALLLLSTVEVAAGGFVFWQISARLFTPDEVGRTSALITASALIANLALLGMQNSVIRYLHEWDDPAGTVNSAVTVVTAAAAFGAVAVRGRRRAVRPGSGHAAPAGQRRRVRRLHSRPGGDPDQ